MNVMYLLLSLLAIFVVLCASELGWRKHWLKNEFGRKFVHITVGSFVAFWPFYLSWSQIRLVSLAFLVVVILSHQFKLFRAINSVQRPTYGEIFFAISVGLLTFITHSPAMYAVAILQMSLADGFAAIIGTRFGRDNKYHIFSNTKSLAGTLTFAILSLLILIGYGMFAIAGLPVAYIILGMLICTAAENLATFGLDNLFVPLFIGLLLAHW